MKGRRPRVGGAGSLLRPGCLSGKAMFPASSGRLDAAHTFIRVALPDALVRIAQVDRLIRVNFQVRFKQT